MTGKMDEKQKGHQNSYLSFMLNNEIFASNVSKVLNILELVRITEIPQSPPYIKGVINLRGDVLPVIDTRIKFGMSPTVLGKDTCILVMEIEIEGETLKVGALVDSVVEVMEISDSELLPSPTIGENYKINFIQSMAEYNDQFIMILDIDKVLTTNEIIDIKNSSNLESTIKDKQKESKTSKKKANKELVTEK